MPYCLAFLVVMCGLMAKSDVDIVRDRGKNRIILLSCIVGILAYFAVIAPMQIHSVRYGDAPVWQKHIIVGALCLGIAVVAFAKQAGDHVFYKKFNSTWANVPLKVVTASIFLFLVYSLFCAAVLSMTWPFYKGVEPRTFFWGISVIIPGVITTGILGLLAGFLFWRISAWSDKKETANEP
jgi:hypothetical protein